MSLTAKCPRCGMYAHDGQCLFEDPDRAATHDQLLAAQSDTAKLRDLAQRLAQTAANYKREVMDPLSSGDAERAAYNALTETLTEARAAGLLSGEGK